MTFFGGVADCGNDSADSMDLSVDEVSCRLYTLPLPVVVKSDDSLMLAGLEVYLSDSAIEPRFDVVSVVVLRLDGLASSESI